MTTKQIGRNCSFLANARNELASANGGVRSQVGEETGRG
jgi:hypothetical protein